jgi:hypothetical protein
MLAMTNSKLMICIGGQCQACYTVVVVAYFKVQSCIYFGGSQENGENLWWSKRPIHSTHKQNVSHWQFYSSIIEYLQYGTEYLQFN